MPPIGVVMPPSRGSDATSGNIDKVPIMRMLFHGPGTSFIRPAIRLQAVGGVQHGIVDTLAGLKATHDLTSNRGNIIHGEAPSRMLACAPAKSAHGNLGIMQRNMGPRFAELIADNFDCVVLSLANMIRPDLDLSRFVAALQALAGRVPMIALGLGMQGRHKIEALHPTVREMIALLDANCLILGTRGQQTQDWLHGNGFPKAQALGCPSLYCYPQSILDIDTAELRAAGPSAKVMTAGYLTRSGGHNQNRGIDLIKAMKGLSASYVFQDEFLEYGDQATLPFSYNEGTNMADATMLNAYFTAENKLPVAFRRYYYFNDSSAWRQAAHAHDVYIGDRFHGGIAALQAGRPTVMLAHDNRVEEMCDFFDLPRMTTAEFARKGLARTIDEHLSDAQLDRMKATFRVRHREFTDVMARHDIRVVTRLP